MKFFSLVLVAVMAQAMVSEGGLLGGNGLLGGGLLNDVTQKVGYVLNVALPNNLGLSSGGRWIENPVKNILDITRLGLITKPRSLPVIRDVETCKRDFQNAFLAEVNKYRALHHVPALKLNLNCLSTAQNFAQLLATAKNLKPSVPVNVVESIGQFTTLETHNLKSCAEYAVYTAKKWYDEINFYDFANPILSEKTNHFTQLVWKNVNELGCGISVSADNLISVVVHYKTIGGVLGNLADNVLCL